MDSWNNASTGTKALIIGAVVVIAAILILLLANLLGGTEEPASPTATPIVEVSPVPPTATPLPTPEPGEPPVPVINAPARAVVGQPVTFDASRSSGANPITNFFWDFGDGTTVDAPVVDHVYATAALYNVTLTVVDTQGLSATTASPIAVAQAPTPEPEPPIAAISAPTQGVVGQPIVFDASRSSGANPIVNYLWQFGDGATADALVVEHAYSAPGIYNVTLTVVDTANQQGTATSQTTIAPAPVQPTPAPTEEPPAASPLPGTSWLLISYNNGQGGMVSVLAGTEITALFGIDGTLSGSAGCNTYSTTYTVDGNSLAIGPPVTTGQACTEPVGVMEQESAYLEALSATASYEIQGDQLTLRSAAGQVVAQYVSMVASTSR
jgi:heat shock protein HslJ